MSFHGGLIGVVIASIWFSKKNNMILLNTLILFQLLPDRIFFGRISNFINSELYGIETNVPWAVKFIKVDDLYRHPSQLYEAFFEGIILFFILLYFRNKTFAKIQVLFQVYFYFFTQVLE